MPAFHKGHGPTTVLTLEKKMKKEDDIHIEMLEKKNVSFLEQAERQHALQANVNMLTEAAKKKRANDKI